MDLQRLLIFGVFAFSAIFLWEAWQQEKQLKNPSPVVEVAPPLPADVPAPQVVPPANGATDVPTHDDPSSSFATATASSSSELPLITITTDLYIAKIDPVGGVIVDMALLKQPDSQDKNKPYRALQRDGGRYLVAQTGLLGAEMPNHHSVYQILTSQRELQTDENEFQLRLGATATNGARVEQFFTFYRDSYVIDIGYVFHNDTSSAQSPSAYFQFTRDKQEASKRNAMAPSAYTGPVVYDETDKFVKVKFDEMDKLAIEPERKLPYTPDNDNGWVAMIEHYFVTAWALPDGNHTQRRFFTRNVGNGKYTAGLILPFATIAPGASAEISVPMYAGPQEQDTLKALAKDLNRVVDYGMLTVIAAPMFWLLKFLHGLIGNWGWAIIAMTIIIRIVFYPLNAAAARSMAKMRIAAPKIKALQEQFKDDKQQLQMKMMEMYKQEKINPLGGCLPILVQMPFFIALFWVLLSAAELRYAPWLGWITNLSAPDPYFILPALYAISAFLQMRLSPTPVGDPMQARMLQMMPVIFAVLFVFFPSGLVLYWFVGNLFQIGQQWHMNRMLEREAAAKT
ncbi:MAG: membrane protein insertase YidC [Burkholderiales bacterium]|jgi:YidC/Oxa1 family membrane protein insertase|nr:membrane protein insertase YidC [Burkholderiales bacterium]